MSYVICNKRGEYMTRAEVPVTWSTDRSAALTFNLFDAASKTIKKLYGPSTARYVGARVVYEAEDTKP